MASLDPERFRWDVARNTFYVASSKLLYFATPKAACTAWKWWIADLAGISRADIINRATFGREAIEDLLVHDGIARCAPDVQSFDLKKVQEHYADPDMFRFALVRNPYTRIFSAWASKVLLAESGQVNQEGWPQVQIIPLNTSEIRTSFEAFLEGIETHEYPDAWINSHWIPQSLWIDLVGAAFSRVYPIEQMDIALTEIGQVVHRHGGICPPLRRFNETVLPWQPRFLSEASRARIAHLYSDDFSRFGYDPDHVPGADDLSDEAVSGILSAISHLRARNVRIDAMFSGWADTEEVRVRWMGQAEILRLKQAQERAAHAEAIAASLKEAQDVQLAMATSMKDAQLRIDASMKDAQDAQSHMAMIEASRSWRITRPLRMIMALVRRQNEAG